MKRNIYSFRGSVQEEEPPKHTHEEVFSTLGYKPNFVETKEEEKEPVGPILNPHMVAITRDLNDIVRRACVPLVTFVGMVADKLRENDIRVMLRWDEDTKKSIEQRMEVVKYADTMQEFVMVNRDLGPILMDLYISSVAEEHIEAAKKLKIVEDNKKKIVKQEPLGACFELDDLEGQLDRINGVRQNVTETQERIRELMVEIETLRVNAADPVVITQREAELSRLRAAADAYLAMSGLNLAETERVFAPAWAFEVMPMAIFRKILSVTSLAAIEATCSVVNRIPNCKHFTLKELICSPQVNDQFAFLVAASYLNSGDRAPPANGGGRRRRDSTYINIMTMRQILSEHIFTCHVWFETMVRRRPSRIRAEFQKQITAKSALMDPHHLGAWMERMMKYKKQLPEFELVVSQN